MPHDDPDHVLHELVVGDAGAIAEIVERARTSDDVTTIVAAALFAPDARDALIDRAVRIAVTTKDRQLLEIASAHVAGHPGRVEDLARDHLADHPESVLVAWITSTSKHATDPQKDLP